MTLRHAVPGFRFRGARGVTMGLAILAVGFSAAMGARAQNTVPAPAPAVKATPAPQAGEDNLFSAAAKALADGGGQLKYAEKNFGEFLARFPQSPRAPEAALRQAQCRFQLGAHASALELLRGRFDRAGSLQGEYLYWIAECELQLGKPEAAQAEFARLLREFPKSARALEASYGEAEALLKQKSYAAVIQRLQDPAGVFRTQAAARPEDEVVSLGLLTLGEALLTSGQAREFPKELRDELFARYDTFSIELQWRWHHLEYRNHMAGKQFEKAMASADNLIQLAGDIVDGEWRAESITCKAEAQIGLGKVDDAVETYRRALDTGIPRERRREALNRIVALRVGQNKNQEGIAFLQTIVTNYPTAKDLDLVHLTIGQMSLEAFELNQGGSAPATPDLLSNTTNHLGLAAFEFERVIKGFTNSVFLGDARLHRGECLEIAGDYAQALAEFVRAEAAARARTNRLLQARAVYKQGDAQFKLTNHLAAVTNYLRALDDFGDLPESRTGFGERAVHQIATAAILAGDLRLARTALQRMRVEHPRSESYARVALQVGQALNDAGEHDLALTVFTACKEDFDKNGVPTPLAPELMLASSATYSAKGEWASAIPVVDAWVKGEANADHPLRARAEFELGRLYANNGNLTNAFDLYAAFVETHKTNHLAAYAHKWLADYHFNRGDATVDKAEKSYQIIFQSTNWPISELTHEALFMAGRCAVARQALADSRRDYFSKLASDKNAPGEWRARAFFAIGDTYILESRQGDRAERWSKAINAFNEIVANYTNSTYFPLALGRLGDCNLQKGSLVDVKHYDDALGFYRRAAAHPGADISTRSEAKVALGFTLKIKAGLQTPADAALLEAAREQWSDVLYFDKLKRGGEERPDPFWTERAGLALVEALVEEGDVNGAVSVLRGLGRRHEFLRKSLEARIKALTEGPTGAPSTARVD